jgi:CheY-like chemotaxis protein
VKQSGGYIWVYSEPAMGTIFKIYLPRVDALSQQLKQQESEMAIEGHETILFAEDSEALREMTRDYLKSLGYTVIDAGSGKEAIRQARDFAGSVDLLLTDVIMSEMSGPELANEMRSFSPKIKVLFTSGYTDDAIARQGILNVDVCFIQKPYRPRALAKKIRQTLDAPVVSKFLSIT